jgi:hypothetical protein
LPNESVCCKSSVFSENTKETRRTSLLRDNVENTITVLEWKNIQSVFLLNRKATAQSSSEFLLDSLKMTLTVTVYLDPVANC